ncbi:MAG TPA: TIGR03557 family F420-dependent LLM class oxidoreductase, partial [Tepidiformaceae bacterium]|nr:TIGR03557 family F420-dependent LLM class oxidoreductase [Tepidiformaceae bacterium]
AVTCPTIRMHPAIIAQAAATAAAMMPGRFFLGLGSGENLNEHITGEPWPPPASRTDMLEEAIQVIRELWAGDEVSMEGAYYTVNRATLFTLPPEPPPIVVAAASPVSIRIAAANDGLITTSPEAAMIETFDEAGGQGKPRYAQVGLCWDEDATRAVEIAHRQWPIAALPWNVKTDVATPDGFESIAELVRPEDIAEAIPCGPDLDIIRESIRSATAAGFDHITLHQIGPRLGDFIDLFERELAPSL